MKYKKVYTIIQETPSTGLLINHGTYDTYDKALGIAYGVLNMFAEEEIKYNEKTLKIDKPYDDVCISPLYFEEGGENLAMDLRLKNNSEDNYHTYIRCLILPYQYPYWMTTDEIDRLEKEENE